jgi:hypothetical protein
VGEFSLHAGVTGEAHESQKLERLCRYIARPAISEKRLSISAQGTAVRTQDAVEDRASAASEGAASTASVAAQRPSGTTHVEFESIDFIAKAGGAGPATMRASDPVPRRVYSGHPALRPSGQPIGCSKSLQAISVGIDVNTCIHCGGTVRIVASIEEPAAIRAILGHFEKHAALEEAHYRPPARAPPAEAA